MSSDVQPKFKIIAPEKAILSSQFKYKRIFNGPHQGKIFYYWSSRNDAELSADFSTFNSFSITEPIINSARSDYANEFYAIHHHDSFSLIFQSPENTGYIKPFYSFIKNEFNPASDSLECYSDMLALFNLDNDYTIKPDKLNQICSYRDNLVTQLNRQADNINQINELLISVLKFLDYQISLKSSSSVLKNSISKLFNYYILGGKKLDSLDLDFLDANDTADKSYEHALQTSKNGLCYLLSFRDPTIEAAVDLVKVLHPLEIVIEKAIKEERIFTPKEYRLLSMPIPLDVANKMRANATNNPKKLETIVMSMEVVKKFIIEEECHSLIGRVSSLITKIQIEVLSGDEKASKNAVRNWVVKYATAANIPYSQKEENNKQ